MRDPSIDTERLLETFLSAVRIDSPAGEEAAFAAWCAERLTALGFAVRFDASGPLTGSDTGNLIAELSGSEDGLTVVLSAHLDTVEPGRGIDPIVEDGVVTSRGETILGADDKAGVAAILEALTRLHDTGRAHAPIRVLLTTGEEMGLKGAKALSREDCAGDLCLVLDADGSPGGIVSAAPTHHTFAATFSGHAAHAGVEPEKGRSAVVMAANAITSMRLGRLDHETTANVGRIEGGSATNVVSATCTLTGECRSIDPAKAEAARDEMDAAMKAAAASKGGAVTVHWTKEYDGFRFDEDDPRLRLVEDACRAADLVPRRFPTGGGSDGNVLSSKGLPSLVLACGMSDVHGTKERIAVSDLEAMTRLVLAVLERAVAAR